MIQLFKSIRRVATSKSFYDFPTIDGRISLDDPLHIENKKAMG
jgi:hypothetical protein